MGREAKLSNQALTEKLHEEDEQCREQGKQSSNNQEFFFNPLSPLRGPLPLLKGACHEEAIKQ